MRGRAGACWEMQYKNNEGTVTDGGRSTWTPVENDGNKLTSSGQKTLKEEEKVFICVFGISEKKGDDSYEI